MTDLKTGLAPLAAKFPATFPGRVALTESGFVIVISAERAKDFVGGICPTPVASDKSIFLPNNEPGNSWIVRASNTNEVMARFRPNKIWKEPPQIFGSTEVTIRREAQGFSFTLPEGRKVVRRQGSAEKATHTLDEVSAAKRLINEAIYQHGLVLSLDGNGCLTIRMEREL